MGNAKNEMTLERKDGLSKLMEWYWTRGNPNNLITKEDYSFIYDIWNNGLSFYGPDVQDRLNKIREIYINDLQNGNN